MAVLTHALTLHRPWAGLILYGNKGVENRSWAPPPRLGRIALHAGRTLNRALLTDLEEQLGQPVRDELTDQGLVGTVRVMGAHSAARCPGGPACHTWAAETGWHWMLSSPWPLPRPVPARGHQKLWALSPEQQQAIATLTVASRL